MSCKRPRVDSTGRLQRGRLGRALLLARQRRVQPRPVAVEDDRLVWVIGDLLADCVVIGCDSMLFVDGALCGKPGSADAARTQWESMAGTIGHLLTGHALLRIVGGVITHTDGDTGTTAVHFGTPTDVEITRYIASGEPIQVAGAFTLDGLGGWFVERIEGDPSNVIGISMPLVRRMAQGAGLSITELWT